MLLNMFSIQISSNPYVPTKPFKSERIISLMHTNPPTHKRHLSPTFTPFHPKTANNPPTCRDVQCVYLHTLIHFPFLIPTTPQKTNQTLLKPHSCRDVHHVEILLENKNRAMLSPMSKINRAYDRDGMINTTIKPNLKRIPSANSTPLTFAYNSSLFLT
jgi:hypothetical protein